MKKIAFIVGTLNEEETIGPLIDSIKKNSYQKKEIIVVDGGSKDKTIEIAKSKGAIVLIEEGKNKCPANAWNQAINYTDAELICLLGADFLLPDEKFAEKTARAFDDPKVAGVYTEVRTEEETIVERIVSCFGKSMHPNVFRKDAILAIGGFPIIGFGEDRIFTRSFLKYAEENKMRVDYVSDTYYSGHAVQTVGALYKQAKWYGRTSLLYLREYFLESTPFEMLKETVAVNFKMGYFLLFALSVIFFNTQFIYYFLIPFVLIALTTVVKNLTMPYHTLKIFTNLVSGYGFFIGIASYIFGLNKYRGRG